MRKRIVALVMALVMMLGIAVPASAAEVVSASAAEEVTVSATEVTPALANENVAVVDDYYGGWYGIGAWESIQFQVRLDPYIGFTKTFYVRTDPDDDNPDIQGGFYLYLYNANGKLVSNDWFIGYEEFSSWKFTLPSSGMYTVKVVSYCNTDCSILAYWL